MTRLDALTQSEINTMRDEERAKCNHVFKSVPTGSGYMPYLKCAKCGKLEADE